MIVIISSPSGAGKSSICKNLLKLDNKLKISISDTTRVPRDNEVDGKDYNFISEKKFKEKIENKEYAEYASVFGNFYGSLHSNVMDLLKNEYDVLFDIDWQGAQQLKKSSYSNILSFFIVPPSKDIIYQRLLSRSELSGDNEDAINRRMSFYETEISHKEEYDHVVINDNIRICTETIYELIQQRRSLI